jgi:hypothetical protein
LESSENVARKSGWEPLSTRSSIWLLEKGDSLGDSSMLGKKAFSENGGGGTHVSSKISLLGMAEATFHEIKHVAL